LAHPTSGWVPLCRGRSPSSSGPSPTKGGWFHPVHIHLIDGKIIARNTNGGKPFAWEGGPKVVYYAGENESIPR
jgi:hypothetical protein